MVRMDITPYVEQLRHDLQNAAEVGDDQARAAAGRLLLALDPAARLVLMDALSQAASEITADLPSGAVEVRLAGREIGFVVDVPAGPPAPPSPPPPPGATEEAEDASLARVTLRLPETVKRRAEELAGESGQSLNTWLVGLVRQATATGVPPTPSSPPWPFSGSGGRHQLSGWL